ncbi:MAG: hypothetical protein WD118_09575 [Phycisphaeraceae bacterium]
MSVGDGDAHDVEGDRGGRGRCEGPVKSSDNKGVINVTQRRAPSRYLITG